MTARLPLAVGIMIFVVAVASSQIVIHSLTARLEKQVEVVGRVYLDGLWAALLPHVRSGDGLAARSIIERAFQFHDGISERQLVLFDRDGRIVVQMSPDIWASKVHLIPSEIASADEGGVFDRDRRGFWTWRRLREDGEIIGTVVAQLDIRELAGDRRRLRLFLIGFDLLFSGILAIAGFFLARRVQRPINVLTDHLQAAAKENPQSIPERSIPQDDREIAGMLHAYNGMVEATREREGMVSQLALQEREAVLGRLMGTIAHEIRNPLAGILTAIGTVRKFGDRLEARTSALDFIERGILALRDVVTATLETHRGTSSWRDLNSDDLQDMRLLAIAAGKARQVTVEVQQTLPGKIALPATQVRQILLNLLLNAVAASPLGGIVRLEAKITEDRVQFEVFDQGEGMNVEHSRRLQGMPAAQSGSGLGIHIIARLAKQLGGDISVESGAEAGTRIIVIFPLRRNENKPNE